jgi:hypothetical protein
MSSIDITKEQDLRQSESRAIIRKAMDMAMGCYIEQESSKFDQWRDQTKWQLTQHLRHEISEIERSKTLTAQLHNALDACSLGAILAAKIMEEEDNLTTTHRDS